jgi:hypothetical protein
MTALRMSASDVSVFYATFVRRLKAKAALKAIGHEGRRSPAPRIASTQQRTMETYDLRTLKGECVTDPFEARNIHGANPARSMGPVQVCRVVRDPSKERPLVTQTLSDAFD